MYVAPPEQFLDSPNDMCMYLCTHMHIAHTVVWNPFCHTIPVLLATTLWNDSDWAQEIVSTISVVCKHWDICRSHEVVIGRIYNAFGWSYICMFQIHEKFHHFYFNICCCLPIGLYSVPEQSVKQLDIAHVVSPIDPNTYLPRLALIPHTFFI